MQKNYVVKLSNQSKKNHFEEGSNSFCKICKSYFSNAIYNSRVKKSSYQNRVIHYDVTNRVTNSEFLFLISRASNSCEKNFKIVSEIVTRNF